MKEDKMAGLLSLGLMVAGALVFYSIYQPRQPGQPSSENGTYYGNGSLSPSRTFEEILNAPAITPSFEAIVAARPVEQVLLSGEKLAESVFSGARIPVPQQAQQEALAKSAAYTAAITPTVSTLQFTGQTGISRALALSAPLYAAHQANLAAKYQTDLANWTRDYALATARRDWARVTALAAQKPQAPK